MYYSGIAAILATNEVRNLIRAYQLIRLYEVAKGKADYNATF